MMKVRDLLEVIEFDEVDIFIKPNGKNMYFQGTVGTVPECLKLGEILSISPQVYANYTEDDTGRSMPHSNRLFRPGLGVWVDPMPEMDEILLHQPEFGKDFSGENFDKLYEQFFEIPVEERRAALIEKAEKSKEITVADKLQEETDRRRAAEAELEAIKAMTLWQRVFGWGKNR